MAGGWVGAGGSRCLWQCRGRGQSHNRSGGQKYISNVYYTRNMSPFTKFMIRRVAREAGQCPDTWSPLPLSPLDPCSLSLPLAVTDQAQLLQWPGHHQVKLQKECSLCRAHRQSWSLEVNIRSGIKFDCFHSLSAFLISRYYICLHIEFVLELLENSLPNLAPQFLFDICKR